MKSAVKTARPGGSPGVDRRGGSSRSPRGGSVGLRPCRSSRRTGPAERRLRRQRARHRVEVRVERHRQMTRGSRRARPARRREHARAAVLAAEHRAGLAHVEAHALPQDQAGAQRAAVHRHRAARAVAGRCQTLPSSPPSKWHEAHELLKLPAGLRARGVLEELVARGAPRRHRVGPECVGIWLPLRQIDAPAEVDAQHRQRARASFITYRARRRSPSSVRHERHAHRQVAHRRRRVERGALDWKSMRGGNTSRASACCR
jgi:hypothetical protein